MATGDPVGRGREPFFPSCDILPWQFAAPSQLRHVFALAPPREQRRVDQELSGNGFPFGGGKPVVGREAHHDNIVTSATLSDNCSVSSCRPSPATVVHLCSHQISREDVAGESTEGSPATAAGLFCFLRPLPNSHLG